MLYDAISSRTISKGSLSCISTGSSLSRAGFSNDLSLMAMDSDGMLSMLFATNLMLGQIGQDPANAELVQERIEDVRSRLEINPRYGEVAEDEQQLVQPVQHPWLTGADA